MLLSLIGLTLLGVIVGLVALYKKFTVWVFIAVSYLMVLYIMGWQVAAQRYITYREVERIYDYEFHKTDDFHVVLYLPDEHITYIRDEAEFYTELAAKNKPLLVRIRAYNMYEQMVEEDLELTPLLPDVSVVSQPATNPDPKPVAATKPVKKGCYTLAQKRWWYQHRYLARKAKTIKPIKPIKAIVIKAKPVPKALISYPYELLDKYAPKKTRIVAHGFAKRFMRQNIEQFVLLTERGELYVVKYTKEGFVAGRIKPNYSISHEIDTQYEVIISPLVSAQIKGIL